MQGVGSRVARVAEAAAVPEGVLLAALTDAAPCHGDAMSRLSVIVPGRNYTSGMAPDELPAAPRAAARVCPEGAGGSSAPWAVYVSCKVGWIEVAND